MLMPCQVLQLSNQPSLAPNSQLPAPYSPSLLPPAPDGSAERRPPSESLRKPWEGETLSSRPGTRCFDPTYQRISDVSCFGFPGFLF
jgi:hypothetical protein